MLINNKEIEIKKEIKDVTLDEERALYNLTDAVVSNVYIKGPRDGESALKEARNVKVVDSHFSLRYPFWHITNFELENCMMDEGVRAALWYGKKGTINKCTINGVKFMRESRDITINDSKIVSPEFGWRCDNINITSSILTSEYFLFESSHISLDNVEMHGKYSFQYVNRGIITNSKLDTKDAFWHTKNVTVINSEIKGEYLGWYSKNLTLINCKIKGTQPLCYCDNLRLINCEMIDCDLAFEYSSVNATVTGHIDSVKNPRRGLIMCESCGEVIEDNPVMKCAGKVAIKK